MGQNTLIALVLSHFWGRHNETQLRHNAPVWTPVFKLFVPPDLPGDLKHITAILHSTGFPTNDTSYLRQALWNLLKCCSVGFAHLYFLHYKYPSLIRLTKGTAFGGNAFILDVRFSEISENTPKSFSKSEIVHENNQEKLQVTGPSEITWKTGKYIPGIISQEWLTQLLPTSVSYGLRKQHTWSDCHNTVYHVFSLILHKGAKKRVPFHIFGKDSP